MGKVEKKDSTDGLGKAIGDDFDGDDSDEGKDADESEDKSGGKDEKSTGETGDDDDQDESTESKDDDEEGSDKVSMTKQELEDMVNTAVSKAVAQTNSTKDKALAEQAKVAREREEETERQREQQSLTGLTGEDLAQQRGKIDVARERRAVAAEKQEASDMSRIANAERLSVANSKFGATFDELAACKSPQEQEALVLEREKTYWQRVAEGKQTAGEDADKDTVKAGGKKKSGKDKKDAPAGSKKSTDTGARGSASGSEKATEGNTLASFADGLAKDGVVPSKGFTKVDA